MYKPTQRYPLMIVPQPAPSLKASSPKSEEAFTDASDGSDTAARVPYLHLLPDDGEDLPDALGTDD